ncbi:MAG: hypothetical protein IKL29_08000 [Bacteroidaceae bacterium]|nr:hypothetical protein [Bacteroidaceae bacterium]
MKKAIKPAVLFCTGGSIYIIIEILWRAFRGSNPTHWTMFILGGLCFLAIGAVNEYLSWETPFWKQALIGAISVLVLEFVFGCILNIWLGLNVWDYSDAPFNILGQVCLPFAFAWILLSAVAIVLDDYLRYWLFDEDKPKYRWI